MINKTTIIWKFIPGKVTTRSITFKKIIRITVAKVVMKYEKQKDQLIKIYEPHQNTFYMKWICITMLMTANIKRSFTSTFTKVHNYRFTNDRFTYITRTIRILVNITFLTFHCGCRNVAKKRNFYYMVYIYVM